MVGGEMRCYPQLSELLKALSHISSWVLGLKPHTHLISEVFLFVCLLFSEIYQKWTLERTDKHKPATSEAKGDHLTP